MPIRDQLIHDIEWLNKCKKFVILHRITSKSYLNYSIFFSCCPKKSQKGYEANLQLILSLIYIITPRS